MNTAAKRAFAVFWWVLVIATIGWWFFWAMTPHADWGRDLGLWLYVTIGLLPFVAVTLVRWIVTSRWRFGPRW